MKKGGAARLLALGLDRMAADEDNEPTGLTVSNRDSSIGALLGARNPDRNSLIFFTQQHGENNLFKIVPNNQHGGDEQGDDDDGHGKGKHGDD